MKRLTLQRLSETRTETMGQLRFGASTVCTIERRWIPDSPGGRPFESCVPAGVYGLRRHTRANGDRVLALINPGLGVYYDRNDTPRNVGRYLILIHPANWAHELAGCIAPGLGKAASDQGPMVTESRSAMEAIMRYVGDDAAEIEIIGSNVYREAA